MRTEGQEQTRIRAGRHQHPDDGACLMEYVSMLAGGTFTDAPRCTDPLLAELARLVNDSVGDDARASLIRFAPRLRALPRTTPEASPKIVAAALDAALRERPDRRALHRHRRRALSRAAAATAAVPGLGYLDRLRDSLYRRGRARHALACAVYVASGHQASEAERDAVLTGMLEVAMAAAGTGGPTRRSSCFTRSDVSAALPSPPALVPAACGHRWSRGSGVDALSRGPRLAGDSRYQPCLRGLPRSPAR